MHNGIHNQQLTQTKLPSRIFPTLLPNRFRKPKKATYGMRTRAELLALA